MKKIILDKKILGVSLVLFFCLGVYFSNTLQSMLFPRYIAVRNLVISRDISSYSRMADAIVIGVVREIGQPYWLDERDMIQRDVAFDVEEVLKGDPEIAELVIAVRGGTINSDHVKVEDEVELTPGESVLLFLGTNHEGDYVVFAGSYGKFAISDDGTEVTSIADFRASLEGLIDQIKLSLKESIQSTPIK